jgi:hypothetical protein
VERSRELEQEVDQLELLQQPLVASPEDIAGFKAEADRADAPEEMRILKRKVDAGELSWKDVLEGRAYQDEDVRNALTARLGPLTDVYQDFEDGHTSTTCWKPRAKRGRSATPATSYPAPSPPAEQSEEDYFGSDAALEDPGTPPPPPPAEPPPGPPAPPSPPPVRRRPSNDQPEDDDYFGGSPLSE